MSRRSRLHSRNWYRCLWLDMRSRERFYARQRRWLAGQMHVSESDSPSHRRMLAATGSLIATTIRGANQSRRMLGL